MTGRSGKGTARQTFRFDPQLWEWFGANTGGADRTDILKALILNWMHAGEYPDRPASPPERSPEVETALAEEVKRRESKASGSKASTAD